MRFFQKRGAGSTSVCQSLVISDSWTYSENGTYCELYQSWAHSEWDASIWRLLRRSAYPGSIYPNAIGSHESNWPLHLIMCTKKSELLLWRNPVVHIWETFGIMFLKFLTGSQKFLGIPHYGSYNLESIYTPPLATYSQNIVKELGSLGRQLIDCWEISCQ